MLPHVPPEPLGILADDLQEIGETMSRNGSGGVKMNERRSGLWRMGVRASSAKLASTDLGPKVALTQK